MQLTTKNQNQAMLRLKQIKESTSNIEDTINLVDETLSAYANQISDARENIKTMLREVRRK